MHRKFLIIIFLVTVIHAATQDNFPEKCSNFRAWLDQKTATGDWRGYRRQLENKGVTISSNYTTDIGGNPVGGLKKSMVYSGFLDVSAALDFEKIASVKGLALTITNYLASGSNLSAKIGNFFGVQEIYASGNFFFGLLDLSLSLLKDKLTLEAGRLFAGDVFIQNELWQYYVSGGVNDNLSAISSNIFFPSFNIAAWAARFTYQPNNRWQFIGGIYNADPKVKETSRHGLYFSLDMDDGFLAIGQATYKHHQKKESRGLIGSIAFGSYYQSSKFPELADTAKQHHGNYGFYLIIDQMLFQEKWPEFKGADHLRSEATYAEKVKHPYRRQTVTAKDRPKGLTAWFGGYLAPQEKINTQIYQLAAGLLYQGMFPSRAYDVTAFCVMLGKFSKYLEGQKIETVLELNHRFQVGPWCYITPDIQYVIRPNGQANISNALVLGLEMSFNF